MQIGKIIILFFGLMFLASCVERYYLDEDVEGLQKIVIDGTLTDACGNQYVRISKSSSIDRAVFLPETDCYVSVLSEDGREMIYEETEEGLYVFYNEDAVLIGEKYKLIVQTSDSKVYETDFLEVLPCPPVDSLYYDFKTLEGFNASDTLQGIQFYVDFRASDYFGHYYRWKIEETYEYHSTWPKKNYFSVNGYVEGPYDYSTFVCYKTETLDDIFTLSTKQLDRNEFIKAELNHVNSRTQRLMYNYSLLIKQQSLSEEAYEYWRRIKDNNRSDVNLFETQPSIVQGNIYNRNNPDELVLGYFTVSSESTKRIVVPGLDQLNYDEVFYCSPIPIELVIPDSPRPMYLVENVTNEDGQTILAWGFTQCFDCTLLGGSLNKPSFFE